MLGAWPADTVMELLPPVAWDTLERLGLRPVRRADVQAEFAAFGSELRGEIAALGGELRGQIGEVRGQIGELSGRVEAMNGRFDGMLGRQLLADVPVIFATAGLLLAAVKLG